MPSDGKVIGMDSSSHGFSGRTADVERLLAEIQKSPSAENTGAIVLEHAADYDDGFFEALAELIARERAQLSLGRAGTLEALREYLGYVRRRVSEGQMDQMLEELARGAVQDKSDQQPRSNAESGDSPGARHRRCPGTGPGVHGLPGGRAPAKCRT